MTSAEVVLTESRTMREQYASRVEVLDRVKSLTMLADDVHATTEIVASYFEADVDTVKKLVQRNRAELEQHGYRVVRGSEISQFERDTMSLSKVRALALFTRQTILNVAMLLTGSDVAQQVRAYLLKVEEQATPEARAAAVESVGAQSEIERAAVARAQIEMLGVAVSTGLLDRLWASSKTAVIAGRVIGEEPELPEGMKPYYVPDYLKDKGLTGKEVKSEQSWFGKRVKAYAEDQGIEVPEMRHRDLPNGEVRETRAWRREHLPLFEAVWDQYYAEKYARPMFLELGAA